MISTVEPSIPCWIISLKPESDSVQALLDSIMAQGLVAEVFTGVDGTRSMPVLEQGENLDIKKSRLRHLCDMTHSEVGCYLSHLRAIKKAYALGLDRVCVLEDDVQVEPQFGQVVTEIKQLPEPVEFVRLMALKVRKRKLVQSLSQGTHQLTRPERGVLGGQGYIVNRSGMKKIIAYGNSIFEPIDKLFDHYWEFDLNQYGIEPHVLWEKPHASSIKKSNVGRARVTFLYYIFRPFIKGLLSLKRKRYLTSRADEFYPAELPVGKPGRTERMKMSKTT